MDDKLANFLLQVALSSFYYSGQRNGNTVEGAVLICRASRGKVRRALKSLVKAGWMETYVAHGETHYRLKADKHVKADNKNRLD